MRCRSQYRLRLPFDLTAELTAKAVDPVVTMIDQRLVDRADELIRKGEAVLNSARPSQSSRPIRNTTVKLLTRVVESTSLYGLSGGTSL